MNLNEDFIFQINWFMDKPYEEAQEIAANMISSRYDVADKKPQAYNSAVFWGHVLRMMKWKSSQH